MSYLTQRREGAKDDYSLLCGLAALREILIHEIRESLFQGFQSNADAINIAEDAEQLAAQFAAHPRMFRIARQYTPRLAGFFRRSRDSLECFDALGVQKIARNTQRDREV